MPIGNPFLYVNPYPGREDPRYGRGFNKLKFLDTVFYVGEIYIQTPDFSTCKATVRRISSAERAVNPAYVYIF